MKKEELKLSFKGYPFFVEADKSFATQSNLNIVLAMLKDKDREVKSETLQVIPFLLKQISP